MSAGSKWDDLLVRVISGAVMVAVGLGAVAIGGRWFHFAIAASCGVMVWELVSMLDSRRGKSAFLLAGIAGVCLFLSVEVSPAFGLPLLLLPSMAGLGRMERGGVTYAVFTAMILLAGYSMMGLRDDFGLLWMLWLVLCVVATDIAGYFAGRLIGGPKLWPRVSPKKTWSGAVGGWLSAALIGLVFADLTAAGVGLAGVSIAASMASQIGDISESAIKRRAGVKDSSALIPGHGGLLDRFDGMLGAAVFIVIVGQVIGFPPGVQ
ncbi:phosphatidate cytidylyltransferase [Pseudoprimorskyibacter insulae]|uniref:Phosphatidate cytidylyltransferase n=1 Tax=Pseudoprimorskyibacter insulae TaxID=1695997 RepID=A0A2R8AWE7_9RHOB|nr:phosphatidate cytidylyltransferase [Pseudoprimorskyibacter insulae]SPF80371.1 Phosphatidate cytidylyltransferase [Pseudoprimorskyibacter insulae]